MTNTVIQLKKSSTPASVPASLANGELALNFADGVLYYKSANGSIAAISGSGGGGLNYGIVNANGTLVIADSSGATFAILPGDFITVTGDSINDRITIGANVKVVYDTANAAFNYANGLSVGSGAAAFDAANQAGVFANTAYDKANAANVLAYNTGIGANSYANTVGTAGNTYATAVGTAGNTYASSVGTSSNAWVSATFGTVSNTTAAFAAANQSGVVANNANTYADSTYVKKAGDTITGDLVIQGNLTTSGVVTYANTQTLLIGDALITLNNDIPVGVAPSEDAGIEIKRGSLSDVSLLWNEGSDKWTFTNDGTNYRLIASNTDVESANNYAGAMANSANAYAASLTPDLSPAFNKANDSYTVANAAFDKANSANVLAYNTGIGANAYTVAVGTSGNSYSVIIGSSGNAYAQEVGTAGNTYATSVGTSSNAWASATFGTATNTTASFAAANQAGVIANAAFDKANTGGGGGGGGGITTGKAIAMALIFGG